MMVNQPVSSPYATPPSSHGNPPFTFARTELGPRLGDSPTSPPSTSIFPPLPLAGRQLRAPKSPMYVPAVLRPTQRSHRSPLTPPWSLHGSSDSLDGSALKDQRPRSQRSTGSSQRALSHPLVPLPDSLISGEDVGAVEGPPTRKHWKADANAAVCDAPVCHKSFSLFERRHHCRHCGHVFCNAHSYYSIPLDHNAEFHAGGIMSRACQHCWDRFCLWATAKAAGAGEHGVDAANALGSPAAVAAAARERDSGERSTIATSAPRDWHWSTF